jgi:hypothetical protein
MGGRWEGRRGVRRRRKQEGDQCEAGMKRRPKGDGRTQRRRIRRSVRGGSRGVMGGSRRR